MDYPSFLTGIFYVSKFHTGGIGLIFEMEAGPLVSELEDGCTFLLCGVDSAVLLDAYKEMLNVLKK